MAHPRRRALQIGTALNVGWYLLGTVLVAWLTADLAAGVFLVAFGGLIFTMSALFLDHLGLLPRGASLLPKEKRRLWIGTGASLGAGFIILPLGVAGIAYYPALIPPVLVVGAVVPIASGVYAVVALLR